MKILSGLLLIVVAAAAQDVLVIVPPDLAPALAKWRAHRTAQGHTVAVAAPETRDLPGQVRRALKASGDKLRFVVLVGDVRAIPVAYHNGVVIAPHERDPRIANDNYLGDLDGDGVPELAVGRIPADNLAEAQTMLDKVVAYETSADFGMWRRRVNIIAGVGGFGVLQDWAIEQVATKFLRENVPPAYDLHVTYANPRSPFCPPPARVMATTLERFNEGALMVAYLGHGSRLRLDSMVFKRRRYDIFTEDAAYELAARRGSPITLFSACSTGHLDGAPDSLAEVALKQPKGPVAIFAASRVSMPYANGVIAKELLDAMFRLGSKTVGEALVLAKKHMMKPQEGDKGRAFIETLARAYKWKDADRAKECAEHLYLYNLFGDPCMRIPQPGNVALECAAEVKRDTTIAVKGTSTVAGKARVEFARDRTPLARPRTADTDEAFLATYREANAWVKAHVDLDVTKGAFTTELAVPADIPPGNYFVRVYVRGKGAYALGARPVTVLGGEPAER